MAVIIQSYNSILGSMVRKILSDTTLSDLRVGSVISSILESAAQSDFETQTSIVQLIQLFSIDTTTGSDLDNRAAEFNVTRQVAIPSTDSVRIGDSSFIKKSSKIYIGLPAPVVGDVAIHVEDAALFPPTGSVYVGRNTGNYEGPLAYSSIVNNTSYWTINLSTSITKNHTTVETVILSQGGNRVIAAGATVRTKANNFSPAVNFTVTRKVTLIDGETTLDGVPVTSTIAGTLGNVPAGAVREFASNPFSGATVTNITSFTNGRDLESDSDLRARIRNAIQLIARGTKKSILEAVSGVSDADENKRVASASLSEPISSVVPAQLYIDDGTGFEPSFAGQGVESVVVDAAGSEQFLQISNFPITPPMLVSGADQPYGIQVGATLTIKVDNSQETITFAATDFHVPGLVKSAEVINTINAKSNLVTARSVRNKTGVAIVARRFSDGTDPETMTVVGGDANDSIRFPTTRSKTLSLYKNGTILSKNSNIAVTFSIVRTSWVFGVSTLAARFLLQVDNTPVQDVTITDLDFIAYSVTYKTATAEQWATVLGTKLAGVSITVESNEIKIASNKTNSSAARVQLLLTDNLGSRAIAKAIWQSGTTVRYSGTTSMSTAGIIVGDQVTFTGFSTPGNNGTYTVTRVATDDYIEVLNSNRTSATGDESGATAFANPQKEDFTLVAFGSAVDVSGTASDYTLNRFSGQLQLNTELQAHDTLTAGSEYTRAYVDSQSSVAGKYNFPIVQDVAPAFFVAIDAASTKVNILLSLGDTITQGRVGVSNDVQLQTNRLNGFLALTVGDFVYISTKSTLGTGAYATWFPSYATGVYEVTALIDGQTVKIRQPDASYPTLPTVITGTVDSLSDIQAFRTDGMVQKISLLGTNLLATDVIALINPQIYFGNAVVVGTDTVRIQSLSFDQDVSNIYILAQAGTGSNLFLQGHSGVGSQPHIGYKVASVEHTSFPKMKDGLAGLFANTLARGFIYGQTTSSDITAPYVHNDSTKTFLSDISVGDAIKYQSGINNQRILGIRSVDSNTALTPQSYNEIRPIFESDSYLIAAPHKFSPYDNFVVELDQDSTNKTFLIPMYRTGRISGITTSTTFDAYDMDSASGTTFNDVIWQDFDFQDFAVHFRARNVYKSSVANAGMIIRSAKYGEVGEKIRFSIVYPTSGSQATYAKHNVEYDNTLVQVFLGSGANHSGISNVGAGYKINRTGQLLTLTYATGTSPNFSGNGVIIGDIANISDSAFSSHSSSFIGSGKVTAASATSLTVKLPGLSTISTSYAITSAADAGGGTSTLYAMANTGLIQAGDKIDVSGFSKAIINGVFTVTSVVPNSSVTVSNSLRQTISHSTTGFRRTSPTIVYLQFAGTLTGQVSVGETIIVSDLSNASLNGSFTVLSVFTTTLANDTIEYSSAGADLPITVSATQALWQAGNTVRYTITNTSAISIGNTVTITGFSNSDNNGSFLVTNVSVGNWIECTTTRSNAVNDEVGPVVGFARPTYYVPDVGGTVKALREETAAANGDLIITQSLANGIQSFPLSSTTANSVISTINSDSFVSKVVTAVNTSSSTGVGVIVDATFDEPASVGYSHTIGDSYISMFDGINYARDFTSAAFNPQKNFTLKTPIGFSHVDYDVSTAPNITGEVAGEYFKLVPTTHRNIEKWFNESSITSFPILGSAHVTANGGALEIATQTVGTAGAVRVSGGSANGIQSFLKAPAGLDTGTQQLSINQADSSSITNNLVVLVENQIESKKPRQFAAGNVVGVDNINGTTGSFRTTVRAVSFAVSDVVMVTDVSASYGRVAGIVWRYQVFGTTGSFTNAVIGDLLRVSHTNFNGANKTPTSTGNGEFSFFPIVGVATNGNSVDVHNPSGIAEGPIALTGAANIFVCPSFLIEWKHKLAAASSMKVEALEFKNMFKYTWVSGGSNPRWMNNGVTLDDYVTISGNTFLPVNRGTFRVVAVDDTYFVIENAAGTEELATTDIPTDIRFFYSESTIGGDKVNVSDLTFLEANRGTHTVVNYGTNVSYTQYVTVNITNSTTQASVVLSGLPNTFFITDGVAYRSYRYIVNYAIDPTNAEVATVYVKPGINTHKMSNAYGTSITPVQKFNFATDTDIGVDGYRYYTGLLRTVQRTVDGYDPDPINYPGYKAAGTQIEVVPPLTRTISVNISVRPSGGINLAALSDAIKAAILNYITGLGVGSDVIVSEITAAAMAVEGVESATLFDPDPNVERIVVQDNEKAVITIDEITVSSV